MPTIQETLYTAINNALTSPEQGEKYFRRPQGSFIPKLRDSDNEGAATVEFLRSMIGDGLFTEVTAEAEKIKSSFGKCRYFQATLPSYIEAYEAAVMLSELSEEDLATVRVVVGFHKKLELQSTKIAPRKTNIVHISVGNALDPFAEMGAENVTVFTWYPGRITPNVDLSQGTVKLS